MKPIVIGTRGSPLAMWQAHWVEEQLESVGISSRIKVIRTTGDRLSQTALAKLTATKGAKGVFTKEIDEALLKGRVDVAVHSLKDVPTELNRRLEIAAVPERGDPRDALIGDEFKSLPEGARVGTGSLRRACQLRRLRSDLQIEQIRGNVETRLKKLDEGRYDGLVLAAAGLQRLGLEDRIAEIFEPNVMFPAVGQGALALVIRKNDEQVRGVVGPLNHHESEVAALAERALLQALGVGCQVPMGGYASIQGDRLRLSVLVTAADGRRAYVRVVEGSPTNPGLLGREAAEKLLALGAGELLGKKARAVKKRR